MKIERVRVGYYSKLVTNQATGKKEVIVRAHDPEAQRRFEQVLRNGSKRRAEASDEKLATAK